MEHFNSVLDRILYEGCVCTKAQMLGTILTNIFLLWFTKHLLWVYIAAIFCFGYASGLIFISRFNWNTMKAQHTSQL